MIDSDLTAPSESTAEADIRRLRESIDDIDARLLELLNQRLRVVQRIGHVKARADLPVVDNGRENALIERLVGLNRGPLANDSLRRLFRDIIRMCRAVQSPDGAAPSRETPGV